MSKEFKELQDHWESGRKIIELPHDQTELYRRIKSKKKENYLFYYGTITTLLITFIVVSLFFYFVAPVQASLSRLGVAFMLSGLLLRIIVEMVSIHKAKQVNDFDNTIEATENSIKFYQFRKTIHKIIAPIVIVIYTIGFFMIAPEFSSYMESWNVTLIYASYVIIGMILFFVLRKGVNREMKKLTEIMEIKKEIDG